MKKLRRIRKLLIRRSDLTVWGDSRSLPFTEGQAVVGSGLIGPAHLNPNLDLNLG